MADDDDKPKKHTLDTLFMVYANYQVIPTEIENEMFDSILLSQLDAWLEQAKLMPNPITRTQTGLIYMKYKKWRMEFEDFLEVIQQLSADNGIPLDEFKQTMIDAGIPSGAADMVIVK
ncbi:tubulin polymerization-promoting protein homolog [Drosophila bipectinata]|uniref:tubulin polymerization-promoting protein homolog n=1 Tax=Drosophila bipectinata TaxID=42026 RepID=UPI001C893B46|nr:uncharacterized protein LOC108133544 [Drosophila bipectinata]KAH8262379.1 hypothetical protein KR026_001009 [Drosophila bipectinata]